MRAYGLLLFLIFQSSLMSPAFGMCPTLVCLPRCVMFFCPLRVFDKERERETFFVCGGALESFSVLILMGSF